MKRFILIVLLFAASVCFGANMEIDTVAEFSAARYTAGNHTILASGGDGSGVYSLTMNWSSTADNTFTASGGEVVIDCDGHALTAQRADVSFIGSAAGRIILRNSSSHGFVIDTAAAPNYDDVNVTLEYVDIHAVDVDGKSGIYIQDNSGGDVNLVMTNCRMYDIDKDGLDIQSLYSQKITGTITGTPAAGDTLTGASSGTTATIGRIESGYVIAYQAASTDDFTTDETINFAPSGASMPATAIELTTVTATLTDCIVHDTGVDEGAASGDGLTAHSSQDTINVIGGSYYDNPKSGIHVIKGASATIDANAVFYNNGTKDTAYGDIMYWITNDPADGSFIVWRKQPESSSDPFGSWAVELLGCWLYDCPEWDYDEDGIINFVDFAGARQ